MKQIDLSRVVVGSPSGVQTERDILAHIADELNRTVSRVHDLHPMPANLSSECACSPLQVRDGQLEYLLDLLPIG